MVFFSFFAARAARSFSQVYHSRAPFGETALTRPAGTMIIKAGTGGVGVSG
ncbi:hypothetical protein HMPREF7215_2195 [Pyramidobacter piscolens W5455]|uniref:Uncharacterized protein n=1 Tax=Pyramidobacter piscolens W5455 TaxID=352165 RepID=A0ABP2HW06_9BACT|nr:hypothetical protein HMPREF7215_2195 [Pyramidobacter piscolens W5455]